MTIEVVFETTMAWCPLGPTDVPTYLALDIILDYVPRSTGNTALTPP